MKGRIGLNAGSDFTGIRFRHYDIEQNNIRLQVLTCLVCLQTEKPRAQNSENHAEQRTEHGEPDGDVGSQRAMCFYICSHLFS